MGWISWGMPRAAWRSGPASVAAGLMAAVFAIGASSPANAQLAGALTTGISATKHNLGATGTGNNSLAAGGSTEICVFCHTPHAASTDTNAGPLWNRTAVAATGRTLYSSASLTGGTRSGATGTALAPGAISLACLSCHDGTQAMNAVINAPGSGLAAGANFNTFKGGGDGKITGVAQIGADLNNDHPIGVKYAGGAIDTEQVNAGYNQFSKKEINGAQAFWVDTVVNGVSPAGDRQKTDMWLYPRDATPTTAYVECASCHDPHTKNALFLRIPNDFSSVCLSCHIK